MDIHSLICVRAPYFALESLVVGTTGVEAVIPVEQDLGLEQGPISGAEAGRHLAILGSCALARINPRKERHYYLASAAELERLGPVGSVPAAGLRGQAHGWFTAKRAGRAQCTLFSSGRPLYALDVSYTVLTEATFERLFAHARNEALAAATFNPHARRPVFSALVVRGNRASCLLPALEPELCAGHFDAHPMLPVASVMRHLSDLAGELLSRVTRASVASYVVQRARVRAFQFALPPQQLMLEVEYGGASSYRGHVFTCRATALGGKMIGEMSLVLAVGLAARPTVDRQQLSAS